MKKSIIILLLMISAQVGRAQEFKYYWPWIQESITNLNRSSSSNNIALTNFQASVSNSFANLSNQIANISSVEFLWHVDGFDDIAPFIGTKIVALNYGFWSVDRYDRMMTINTNPPPNREDDIWWKRDDGDLYITPR